MGKRVLVAMSGGVDSSVTAALLLREGYDVVGVTMRLWTKERPDAPPHHRGCCSIEETDDARRVAGILGFPYYVLNFEREFERRVVDYFVGEYARGRTPNPCLACNQFLKFDALLRRAVALGCDYLATGHYARIERGPTRYHLRKALDLSKDQSYVLYTLGQTELERLLFPLGRFTKAQVRALAAALGLPVAAKPDSQEICFLQGQDYRAFLRERLGDQQPGDLVDEEGRVLGRHQGAAGFTVGQRRGLGLALAEPRYVLAVDASANRVVVGREERLYRRVLWAGAVHWVAGEAPAAPVRVAAKVRYRTPEAPATVFPEGARARVEFDQPQRAISPGQAVVFYDGDEVIGGGTIEAVE
ncbi:MAG: tRNA 2-thiouridine(34) synthase MnmA [Chloroflexota bacterium]|nr:tRNA 2-thiouridine(34) synthase MnmA [Dehalococcoidia bacterium]MDW8253234.1 tRNA 2-thiouridine(34) synthase MnmA [Chloroflexota bacterium]